MLLPRDQYDSPPQLSDSKSISNNTYVLEGTMGNDNYGQYDDAFKARALASVTDSMLPVSRSA